MGEDLEEFFLIPVEEANYVQVKSDITEDLTDIAEEQVIQSHTVLKGEAPLNVVIETNDGIEVEADTSDKGGIGGIDDPLADSDAVIPGIATIHDEEGQVKTSIPIKLPSNWTKMFKYPMKKLSVRILHLKLPYKSG